ncbi:MAG: hypothetical protein GX163_10695 [Bacteroidetes bacterium]|jgi:ABC-type thiamin/hydroxymethylpyrimidine transport system permease subunit|nr:hypothetical protein [Bacteroidota bacterium]
MTKSKRFKFPKTVLFGISVLYIVILFVTYFVYYQEPTLECAKRLLAAQIVAFGVQILLNYVNYHSKNKIVILATLFISSIVLAGVLSSFFNFNLMCNLFPML